MSGIRVTYSGLISFVVGLISVLTGLIFTLIVTRSLSPEEFGTWSLIGSVILYVGIIHPIIGFWVTREIARDVNSGKTAVFSSGIFSIGAIFVYVIIAYFVGQTSDAEFGILLFAVIMVPVLFFDRVLTAINLGWKPHTVSFGLLAFEIVKIPSALAFIFFLNMGIQGAILAVVIAHLASITIQLIYARKKLKGMIEKKFLKKWIKLSWLPLYPSLARLLFQLDVLIFLVLTGSVIGLAYWAASITIAKLVRLTDRIAQGLYSKLLGGGKKEFLQENLILLFYVTIPLLATSIVFARPGLFTLNPAYELAFPIVIMLTFRAIFNTFTKIFSISLRGVEKVDMNENSTFRDYLKSKLFSVATILIIQRVLYIGILVIVLLLLTGTVSSQLDLVLYWAIISFVTHIPTTIYLTIMIRKHFTLRLDYVSLTKYLIVSIGLFGLSYFIMEQNLEYKISIYEFLPSLLPYLLLAIGGYLGITYLIDKRTRNLFNAIINELKIK